MRSMFDEKMIKEMAEEVIKDFKPTKLYKHTLQFTSSPYTIILISTHSTAYVRDDFINQNVPPFSVIEKCISIVGLPYLCYLSTEKFGADNPQPYHGLLNYYTQADEEPLMKTQKSLANNFVKDFVRVL